jgi:hypothetical protein
LGFFVLPHPMQIPLIPHFSTPKGRLEFSSK